MSNTDAELEIARRQARQARAHVERQQALVDALSRQGRDAMRARRLWGELRLMQELLQDRVANLEAAASAGTTFSVAAQPAPRAPANAVAQG